MRSILFFVFFCAINIALVRSEWGFYQLYTIKNLQSGLVVDSIGSYTSLQQFNGSRSQLWQLKPTEKVGQFYVTNAQSGLYLFGEPSGSARHQVWTSEILLPDYLDCYQWSVDSDGTIVSAHMNMVLDVWDPNGPPDWIESFVIMTSKTGNQTQQYVFEQQD